MNLNINKLKKDKYNTETNSTKYYLSNCQANIDNNVDKNTKDFLVINRIIKNPGIFKGIFENNKNVVLKLAENDFFINKEYIISKYLYDNGYDGFVRFLCKFSCQDNLSKYSKIDENVYVCDSNGKVKITALLMNEFELGSIKNYHWTKDNIDILKDLLKQTLTVLFKVSKETGFIHKDLHADNIMITKDVFGYFIPVIIDLEMSMFVNNKEIHKDYSYRGSDKDMPLEKIIIANDVKKLIGSLLELPKSKINLDITKLLGKIREIINNETIYEVLYEILPLIDEMEYDIKF